jgi:hypothetical protein
MRNVINQYGIEIDFDVAVTMMDDDIREKIHFDLAPCTDQEFFDEYVKRHAKLYGEESWQPAQKNPVM